MPYYKKRGYRKYTKYGNRKRYYNRRKGSKKNLAKMVKAITLKQVETKFKSWNPYDATTAITSTGRMPGAGFFGGLTQGTGRDQRVGDKILAKGIRWTGLLEGGQSQGALDDDYNLVRIVIFKANKAQMVVGDMGATAPVMENIFNKENIRYLNQVVYDKKILLKSPGLSGAGYMTASKKIKIWIPLKDTIKWTASNLPDYDFYYWMISDSTAAPSPAFANDQLTIYWKDA